VINGWDPNFTAITGENGSGKVSGVRDGMALSFFLPFLVLFFVFFALFLLNAQFSQKSC
jgi:hypothetical protein